MTNHKIRSMDAATLRWMHRQVTSRPYMYDVATLEVYEDEMRRRGYLGKRAK